MLFRCKSCGRPFYASARKTSAECGFCYQKQPALNGEPLRPNDIAWQTLLFPLAVSMEQPSQRYRWLAVMGQSEAVAAEREKALKAWVDSSEATCLEIQSALKNRYISLRDIRAFRSRLADMPDVSSLAPAKAQAEALVEAKYRALLDALMEKAERALSGNPTPETIGGLAMELDQVRDEPSFDLVRLRISQKDSQIKREAERNTFLKYVNRLLANPCDSIPAIEGMLKEVENTRLLTASEKQSYAEQLLKKKDETAALLRKNGGRKKAVTFVKIFFFSAFALIGLAGLLSFWLGAFIKNDDMMKFGAWVLPVWTLILIVFSKLNS